jgi:hypothetical protein
VEVRLIKYICREIAKAKSLYIIKGHDCKIGNMKGRIIAEGGR